MYENSRSREFKIISVTYYHWEIPQRIDQERTNEIFEAMINPTYRQILVDIKDNSKTVLQILKNLELSRR